MPTASQKGDLDPPDEVTTEAVRGFMTGVFRFGSVSILAHMILILPHPFKFSPSASPPATSQTQSQSQSQPQPQPRSFRPFSKEYIRSRLFYRPIEGFSEWLSPTSRIYRGLTPQFKVFLQIAAMTLGGCIWAERRVNDYVNFMRKVKRAERLQAERAAEEAAVAARFTKSE